MKSLALIILLNFLVFVFIRVVPGAFPERLIGIHTIILIVLREHWSEIVFVSRIVEKLQEICRLILDLRIHMHLAM